MSCIMKMVVRAAMLLAIALLPACFTVTSYVDPRYHEAGYEAIQRPAQPAPINLVCEFQRNGQPLPSAYQQLRGNLERSLRATGVFEPGTDVPGAATLRVTANNIADTAAARAQGFGTGLTFGAAGSLVHDDYEFTFDYRRADGTVMKSAYHHTIHTTIGNADGPPGMTPTTLVGAFARVVEDVTLNFVRDVQIGSRRRVAN